MKHIYIYFTLVFFALCTLNTFAQQNDCEQIFNQGVEFYLSKKYQKSAEKFEHIVNSCGTSKELLYNLGNAYYQQNLLGKAILHYERAIKQYGTDGNISNNLHIAKKDIKKPIREPLFNLKNFYQFLMLDSLAWISIISLAFICLTFFFYKSLIISNKNALVIMLFIFSFSFLTSLLLGYIQKYNSSNEYAIVIEKEASLRSKNELSAPVIMKLSEGTKIQIIQTNNDWAEVGLPNAKKGWVKSSIFSLI